MNKDLNVSGASMRLAKIGMMASVAVVLGFIRFPIIPAVNFLTYDFADIPILITTFVFGPVTGIIVTIIVSFIQAFLLGGDGIYGFVMHILATGIFVIFAGNIYKRNKTKKSAIIGMVIATVAMIILMAIANYFVTPYYYSTTGNGSTFQAMQEMVVGLLPMICLFNLIKGFLNSTITFVVYKRISNFLHGKGKDNTKK